ncbi:MAG: glucose-6-phosphate isomerase [Cystobacterineae bacterium]|nr:glucose-6-phosphate isomerase [Cystobacterineae bacterium]
MNNLSLDLNFAIDQHLKSAGLSKADYERISLQLQQAHELVVSKRKAGKMAFMDLPKQQTILQETIVVAQKLSAAFENLVVLGIGGSSLGPKALFTALCHPYHNFLPLSRRKGMRLFFPDNADSSTFAGLMSTLELERTAFAAITKSGGTAETWAQLLWVVDRLGKEAARRQLVALTDPEKGSLRATARAEGWQALEIPPAVGGRFSVFSPVGLLPAAAAGIDIVELLRGAQNMVERCEKGNVFENPAYMLATTLYLFDLQKKRSTHVLMPYADALRETGDWFVQLWAESLGKKKGDGFVGPTPLRAVGATDQHSLLQLLMEGPEDKLTLFVAVDEPRENLKIPEKVFDLSDLNYLGGHEFHTLLSAERQATAIALAAHGRPSLSIRMPNLRPFAMGELLMLWQIATAFAGFLYEINPFDQPGVEAGKRYTCCLLGRPGYESDVQSYKASNKAWIF